MLAADKLLLQSSIRQNSIALKEKEFNLHHGNFNAVGTQAAVLAGFTVTAFIEFDCPPDTSRPARVSNAGRGASEATRRGGGRVGSDGSRRHGSRWRTRRFGRVGRGAGRVGSDGSRRTRRK